MKTTILAIILLTITLIMLSISAHFVARMDTFDERLDQLEMEVRELEVEFIGYKAEIWERTREYSHIIPVDGGFLGVREDKK
jgi:hypothetical protein